MLINLDLIVIDFLVLGLVGDFTGLFKKFWGNSEIELGSQVLEEGKEFDSDVTVVLFF